MLSDVSRVSFRDRRTSRSILASRKALGILRRITLQTRDQVGRATTNIGKRSIATFYRPALLRQSLYAVSPGQLLGLQPLDNLLPGHTEPVRAGTELLERPERLSS